MYHSVIVLTFPIHCSCGIFTKYQFNINGIVLVVLLSFSFFMSVPDFRYQDGHFNFYNLTPLMSNITHVTHHSFFHYYSSHPHFFTFATPHFNNPCFLLVSTHLYGLQSHNTRVAHLYLFVYTVSISVRLHLVQALHH